MVSQYIFIGTQTNMTAPLAPLFLKRAERAPVFMRSPVLERYVGPAGSPLHVACTTGAGVVPLANVLVRVGDGSTEKSSKPIMLRALALPQPHKCLCIDLGSVLPASLPAMLVLLPKFLPEEVHDPLLAALDGQAYWDVHNYKVGDRILPARRQSLWLTINTSEAASGALGVETPKYDMSETFPALGPTLEFVQTFTGLKFDAALLHKYGPEDHLGMHADKPREGGESDAHDDFGYFIVSISLGCPRHFDVAKMNAAGGRIGPKLRYTYVSAP